MQSKKATKNQPPAEKNRKLRLLITGLSMGIADLVPGVSGGTIAFLYGIYDELLYSIRIITGAVPKLLLRGEFKQSIKIIPFSFLIPLVGGIFLSIFSLAQLFDYLLTNFPVIMWSVFFGLVLGSAFVIRKRVTQWSAARLVLLLAGFLATFLLLGLPNTSVSPTSFVIFATGAIASCAMILPGISGSLIMVMLGQYKNVIGFVSERNVGPLIIFALGALTGLALFSRLLSWLLKNHHSTTIAVLLGVILGSLRRVWPWHTQTTEGLYMNQWPSLNGELFLAIALMATGFFLVLYLEKKGLAQEHTDDIEQKEFKKEIASQHD